jgi:hypothetical protein
VRLVREVLKREIFLFVKQSLASLRQRLSTWGHIVDKKSIRPDPKKVEAVQTWPVSKNVHDVCSFLGLVNYFRKIIEHYSEIAVLLTDLTRKSRPGSGLVVANLTLLSYYCKRSPKLRCYVEYS